MAAKAAKTAPKPSTKAGAAKASKAPAAAQPPAPAPAEKAAAPAAVTLKRIAAELGEAQGLPHRQAEAVLDGVVGPPVGPLKAGDRLRLGGLGVLEVEDRPARSGRDPATGEPVRVAAGETVAFRPAKGLEAAV